MSTDLNARIAISANDQASTVLRGIGGAFGDLFKSIPAPVALAAGALAAIGIGAVAVGAKSVRMAADFQQAMIKSQAEAGLTKQQMTDMGNAILAMAPQVAQAPKDLANGLFYVESAGFAGKNALDTLRLSAQMAASDMSDTSTVAKGLTTAVKAFGYETNQSAFVANQMTVTVSSGKMTMADYAGSIGKVALTSHGFNVSMGETNAGLATLTNNGFPSAAQASTGLNNLLLQFDGNTAKVAKNIHALGVQFDEHKFRSMDLKSQIEYLSTAMKGHDDQLKKVLGGSQVASAAFKALRGDTAGYQATLDKLNDAQKNGGAETAAFAATQQGFNFQMSAAKAAVDAFMIKIGTALLPVLTELMSHVGPLVSAFANWAIQNHIIENIAAGLIAGIQNTSKAIADLVAGITRIIQFFQQNALASDGLKAALAGLAVGVIVWIATLIPAMVVSFVAWAGAAWTAAAGTLAAMAPFILIGAVVALVVFGIIEAVKNWGAIMKWFQGLWASVSSWLMTALHNIASFFIGIWSSIVHGVQVAWAFIVMAAKVALLALVIIIFAPIIAIAALFIWLYQHNIYFKMLVDIIVEVVRAGIAWLIAAWQAGIAWLIAAWQAVVGVATTAWNAVTGAIQAGVNIVLGWLKSVWDTASKSLSDNWNGFVGLAQKAWQAVSGVFSSVWSNYISGPLNNLWNQLVSWFDLGKKMEQFGVNMIQGFINGILSMIGNVGNAASDIASKVASFLGFHSPAKDGPGAQLMTWGPGLISGFSQSIKAALPVLDSTMRITAQHIAGPLTQSSTSVASPQMASSAGGGTTINLTINAPARSRTEAQDIAKTVMDELSRELRRSGNLVTWTSGGRSN